MTSVLIKETIYYGSYLAFPFLVVCVLLFARCIKRRKVFVAVILAGLILVSELFIWARFTEPDMLIVRRSNDTKIGINKRIALIADTHLGVYNDESILKNTVDKINAENVDAVLIAGDFTYHPKDLRKEFAPLSDLNAPIYAILGNHDVEHPGPKIRDELEEVLRSYGVMIINNQAVDFGDGVLVGLGDRWAEEDDVLYLDKISKESDKPIIVLTHNPDTVIDYTADFYLNEKWVTLTGHTHCGQIRIPVLYKYAIPTEGEWYFGGYYDLGSGSNGSMNKLYITCGIGEVGLPLRLFSPPSIDILEL